MCDSLESWTFHEYLILKDGRTIASADGTGTWYRNTVCGESDSESQDFTVKDLRFVANDTEGETTAFVYQSTDRTVNIECSGNPWHDVYTIGNSSFVGIIENSTHSYSNNYFAVWVTPDRLYKESLSLTGYASDYKSEFCDLCGGCNYPITLESGENCKGVLAISAYLDISKDQKYGSVAYNGEMCNYIYSLNAYIKNLQNGETYPIDVSNIKVETPHYSIAITPKK